ncbi:MAG TPA: RNB domain-containing ribonuclease [Terriglobales bacterium]|nr:RNB domain-containing ribonuclease [Terriglobales bacterium]
MVTLSDSAILRKIERQPRHTAGYKQLVRELGVRGNDRRELADRLRQLVARGELVQADGDRYSIPQASKSKNAVTGRLTMHRDGYGFVIPDNAEVQQRISGDIYIHANAIGSAMHGDRVLVELGTIRSDGRAEGRILRVLDRAHPTVVGTFHYGPRYNYVRPMDEKITLDVIIPRGAEIPEAESSAAVPAAQGRAGRSRDSRQDAGATSRHRVIGEEVKHRQVAWEDLEGVVVDAEITEWPTPTQNPRGRVIEILGYEDDFGVDVEIVIRKYHLPHRFPAEVLEEAQSAEDIVSARELQQRRDYRGLPIVTIDGETARDFDDAVHVQRLDNGNFELQVHIADVAQYVTEGSALDREARLRGNSVYFPDRAVPMLPIELSTDICSLRPHVDRLVMSCIMEIDPQGEILGYELNGGVIRSAERMTYTDVNLILEGDAGVRKRYDRLMGEFELMRDLATILNRKRERRGSIDFDLPEPVIEFDEFGLMRSITRSERNIAHRLIEEFMLSANECVGHYLEHKGVPSLYRIHEKPDPKRVYEFESIAAAFGYSLGVGALPVQRFQFKADRRASYGTGKRPREVELPKEVHITPRMYQKLTQKIADKPEERILSYLMLRSLKQARYSEENEGHFALATPTYTHFTSPIRRYPDLIIHRILKDVLHQSETHEHGVAIGKGVPLSSESAASPWSKRREHAAEAKHQQKHVARAPIPQSQGRLTPSAKGTEPIPLEILHEIAEESSQAERRADDAERELMEWKKVKFMEDRVGEDFDGLIVSVTKFGLFVELTDLFVEGLVPLSTLSDDRYTYHENTKQIIGQRSRRTFSLGNQVRVLVDRIDPVQKKIQFALFEERPSRQQHKHKRR